MMNAHVRDNLLETAPAKVTTAGDTVYGTGANAIARLAAGVQGALKRMGAASVPNWLALGAAKQYLRTNAGVTDVEYAGPICQLTRKTADEIINNSTTLQNDDHLVFAIGANETWLFMLLIIYSSPGLGPSFKADITVPAGGTLMSGWRGNATVQSQFIALAASVSAVWVTTAGVQLSLAAHGIVRNGGTAGNVQLRWAQNTATVEDTKVYTDSHILAHRLA